MRNNLTDFLASEPAIFIKLILIFLIGPLDFQITYLFVAIIIDLFFGIKVAKKENSFNYFTLWEKTRNKIVIYVLWIVLFHAFDMVAGLENKARWAIIILLVSMEVLSSIKNTAKLGHTTLANRLEQIYLALVKGNPLLSFLDKEKEGEEAKGGKEDENKKAD